MHRYCYGFFATAAFFAAGSSALVATVPVLAVGARSGLAALRFRGVAEACVVVCVCVCVGGGSSSTCEQEQSRIAC